MTEAELERLLAAAAQDPAERPAFTRALLDSDVYVLGTLAQPAVDGVAQPGTSIGIVSISDGEGPIMPVFTSEASLQATLAALPGTDPRFVRLKCRALFEMTGGSRLVLNPHGRYAKVFLPDEIEALITGREPGLTTEQLEAERRVLVGSPANIPPGLLEVLARFLVQRPVVERAHFGWIVHPDGQAGYLMVVVAEDKDAAMAGFGSVQIGQLTGEETLDVMVVAPGTPEHVLSSVPPFYRRRPPEA